jgi:MFS family permease
MVMVVGTLGYALGFGMYAFVETFPMFLLAMAIITIGEMLVTPVSQAIVARLAPEDMRGRYMATYGFSWVLPSAFGALLAGLIVDNLDPRWLWIGCFFVASASALAYYLLELRVGSATYDFAEARLKIIEQLEEGQITAEQAALRLEAVEANRYARLGSDQTPVEPRHITIKVSSQQAVLAGDGGFLAESDTPDEIRLPLGLVNTFLNTDGRLSSDLDHMDQQALRAAIAHSLDHGSSSLETPGGHRVDVSLDEKKS